MNDSPLRFVYMTTADREEAERIGAMLVKERVAACVNVIGGMTSLYWWDGAVQTDNETVLIAKTRANLVDRLTDLVKANHSYECPCVLSLPIEAGNPQFLSWIMDETKAAAK